MVQVVHAYHKSYPFGLKKESQNTFVQESKLNLKQLEIAILRQKAKIYQAMNNAYFIKLNKVLKEENNLHFVYEYYETSIERYLGMLKKSVGFCMTRELYKSFQADFNANMNEIIDCLIQSEIKAVLMLQNIACTSKNQKDYSFSLKAFIDTEAEYLSISKHNYEPKDSKQKQQKAKNHEFLHQFYEAERKRLAIQFEELAEKIFGKINESTEKKQSPNFIINGTKLIFINKDEKEKDNTQEDEKTKQKIKVNQQARPFETQIRQKTQKKAEKAEPISEKKQDNKAKLKEEKQANAIKNQKKKVDGPIIDFDQSFQPEFKPQEFTKQKTFIYEETDYLDSLEQQLKKIAAEKKQQQIKKTVQTPKQQKMFKGSELKRQSMEQNAQSKQKKHKTQLNQHSQGQIRSQQKNKNNDSINETGMVQSTKSNTSNCNNSNQSNDKKPEKMNKYKMKIITSHEIEIEGGGQGENVQEFQKQIINGIKSGKININDLANNNQKTNSVHRSQPEDAPTGKDLTNSSPAHSKANSKQEEWDKVKQTHDLTKNSNEEKQKKTTVQVENTQILKLKQPPPNKIRTINQIIEKITHNHQNQQNQKQGVNVAKNENINIEARPQSKASMQGLLRKVNQIENHAVLKKQSAESYDKSPQLQRNQVVQQTEVKVEKAENYINKIKQAKSKAQQLLREYTKKKQ